MNRLIPSLALVLFSGAAALPAFAEEKAPRETLKLENPGDYRRELDGAVTRIKEAEARVAARIQELEAELAGLKETKEKLEAARLEAREHLESVDASDDGNWEELKQTIDRWIDEVTNS